MFEEQPKVFKKNINISFVDPNGPTHLSLVHDLIPSASGEGSVSPARMRRLDRAFASRIHNVLISAILRHLVTLGSYVFHV